MIIHYNKNLMEEYNNGIIDWTKYNPNPKYNDTCVKCSIKMIRFYLDMIENDGYRFDHGSNVIDLEFHTHQLANDFLDSKEHHVQRGYTSGYINPEFKK